MNVRILLLIVFVRALNGAEVEQNTDRSMIEKDRNESVRERASKALGPLELFDVVLVCPDAALPYAVGVSYNPGAKGSKVSLWLAGSEKAEVHSLDQRDTKRLKASIEALLDRAGDPDEKDDGKDKEFPLRGFLFNKFHDGPVVGWKSVSIRIGEEPSEDVKTLFRLLIAE